VLSCLLQQMLLHLSHRIQFTSGRWSLDDSWLVICQQCTELLIRAYLWFKSQGEGQSWRLEGSVASSQMTQAGCFTPIQRQMPSLDNISMEPPVRGWRDQVLCAALGSCGVLSTHLMLSKCFHASLSPGIKIVRFALNFCPAFARA